MAALNSAGVSPIIDLGSISTRTRRGRAPTPHGAAGMLANRQSAVLRLVAAGMSNKEIAAELGISQWTVRNHMSAVFGKLGVTNRTQAALHAVRSGFFSV